MALTPFLFLLYSTWDHLLLILLLKTLLNFVFEFAEINDLPCLYIIVYSLPYLNKGREIDYSHSYETLVNGDTNIDKNKETSSRSFKRR